jgi:hypothetical protein
MRSDSGEVPDARGAAAAGNASKSAARRTQFPYHGR